MKSSLVLYYSNLLLASVKIDRNLQLSYDVISWQNGKLFLRKLFIDSKNQQKTPCYESIAICGFDNMAALTQYSNVELIEEFLPLESGNPCQYFDFVFEGIIIKVCRSTISESRVVWIKILEHQSNNLNFDFSSLKALIEGEVLHDRKKAIRQCYLMSEYFLLVITDDYLELINTLRYIPRPRNNTNDQIQGGRSEEELINQRQPNTRTVFYSSVLRGIFSRGGVAEALDRHNKMILFRVQGQDGEEGEYYELDIRRIYEKVEEVAPNWLIEFEQYQVSRKKT